MKALAKIWAQVLRGSSEPARMEISGIARLATALAQQRTAQAADVALLKKALQMQQQSAATMLSALTPAQDLPSHLGQNLNVVA